MSQECYKQGYIDAVQELDEVLTRSLSRNEFTKRGLTHVLNDVIARLHHMSDRAFDEENESKITDELKPQTKSVDEALERIARIIFEQL